jgi:hypothetical protein
MTVHPLERVSQVGMAVRIVGVQADRGPLLHNGFVEARPRCSACHDPHGISTTQVSTSDHTHLINFGTTSVRPETRTGRLEFKDLGRFAGSCTLVCHGKRHNDVRYRDH